MTQIKRWNDDEVIHEGDGTIRELAIKNKADLSGANLRDADLRGADLRDADLSFANLRGANLHGANLHGANLRDANLRGADLSGADLRDANLRGADLSGATYNGVKVKRLWSVGRLYRYNVVIVISKDNTLYIGLGCHFRKALEWQNDFWNNVEEFPDDGSIKTQERQLALEFSIKFGLLHDGEIK